MEIVLAVFASTLFGLFIGLRANRKPKHEHIWKCISARNNSTYNSNDAKYPSRRYTRLLHQCYCGEYKYSEMEGHWETNVVIEKPIIV